MRKLLGMIGGFVALGLAAASVASAQPIGDPCVASDVATNQTGVVVNFVPDAGMSTHVLPEGPKVITGWRAQVPFGFEPIQQQLVVFKPVAEEEVSLIGETGLETVVGGSANTFATRIPVSEGNQIGLRGPDGTLICDPESGHMAGLVEGPWGLGEARHLDITLNTGVPVVATVEEDWDGDGYGNDTQDRCPLVAAVQTECPRISLSSSASVTKRAILLEIGSGDPAKIQVSGQVGWGFRPKNGGAKKRLIIALSGDTVETAKDVTSTVLVPLPRQVKERLARLPRKKTLKAELTVVATNVAGANVTVQRTVKLPGRAKPPR